MRRRSRGPAGAREPARAAATRKKEEEGKDRRRKRQNKTMPSAEPSGLLALAAILAATFALTTLLLDFAWWFGGVPKAGDIGRPGLALDVFVVLTAFAYTSTVLHGFLSRSVAVQVANFAVGALVLVLSASTPEPWYFSPPWWQGTHWGPSIVLQLLSVLLVGACAAARVQVARRGGGEHKELVDDDEGQSELAGGDAYNKIKPAPGRNPAKCIKVCNAIVLAFVVVLLAMVLTLAVIEPRSSCYGTSAFPSATELAVDDAALQPSTVVFGGGALSVSISALGVAVHDGASTTDPVVWATVPGQAFLAVASGPFSATNDHEMGSFDITDDAREFSTRQQLQQVRVLDGGNTVSLSGQLVIRGGQAGDSDQYVPFVFNVSTVAGASRTVELSARVEGSVSPVPRIYLLSAKNASAAVMGFGETFSFWNGVGLCMPVLTVEQGIFRGGTQPHTFLLNLISPGSGGSWQTTYTAVGHYVTSTLRSFTLLSTDFAVFDMRDASRVLVEVVSPELSARVSWGASPKDVVREYAQHTSGLMRALPRWTQEGAIVGLQGGRSAVEGHIDALLAGGVPVKAVWLQDWTGKRDTSFGSRLLWCWKPDLEWYPEWYDFVAGLWSDRGIRTLTYVNPYLADQAPNRSTGELETCDLFVEARDMGCLVLDKGGAEPLVQFSATPDFTFGTVDFTNAACAEWYAKHVIRKNMLGVDPGAPAASNATSAMGWMADFAESLPFDAVLHAGDAGEVHNRFPLLWQRVNQAALEVGNADEVLYFTRSASVLSPGATTLMWLGDQLQSFDALDGMQSALTAALTSGLSGFSLTHSDVGGYTAVSKAVIRVLRTTELNQRWSEFSAFCDAVYRSHEGVLPKDTPQVSDAGSESMHAFARFARVHMLLGAQYRWGLIQEAATQGVPIVRSMWMEHPEDPNTLELSAQFMLGSELVMCPVFGVGVAHVRCYLPAGQWTLLWHAETEASGPRWIDRCPAPIGEPCVWVAKAAAWVSGVRAGLGLSGR